MSDHCVPAPLLLGLLDEPEDQRQSVAHYVPARDGHLLLTGDQGSGRSRTLSLLADQALITKPLGAHDAEGAWDALTTVIPDGTLVLIDDIEALLATFTLEHRDAFVEALMALLRTGPSRGIYLVIASHGGALYATAWMALMKSTLTLGPAAGRATWQNHAVQLALGERPPQGALASASVSKVLWHPGQPFVVVSPRPRLRLAELSAAATAAVHFTDVGRLESQPLQITSEDSAQVFIGDVEDWQSQYSLLAKLRPHATFIFDDCSPAEVRAVRRSRDVLPHTQRGLAVSVTPEGAMSRVRLT